MVRLSSVGSVRYRFFWSWFMLTPWILLDLSFSSLLPFSSVDNMSKREGALETNVVVDSDASLDEFNGTSEDARDMHRLGRAQELKVYAT
jgi:hypothetical protein